MGILYGGKDHYEETSKINWYKKDKNNSKLKKYIELLYNQALILEGSKPENLSLFVKDVVEIMNQAL